MSERLRQGKEKTVIADGTEEAPTPPGVAPKPTPEGEGKCEQTSLLDMVFREAEVIARNLKESGSRR